MHGLMPKCRDGLSTRVRKHSSCDLDLLEVSRTARHIPRCADFSPLIVSRASKRSFTSPLEFAVARIIFSVRSVAASPDDGFIARIPEATLVFAELFPRALNHSAVTTWVILRPLHGTAAMFGSFRAHITKRGGFLKSHHTASLAVTLPRKI